MFVEETTKRTVNHQPSALKNSNHSLRAIESSDVPTVKPQNPNICYNPIFKFFRVFQGTVFQNRAVVLKVFDVRSFFLRTQLF